MTSENSVPFKAILIQNDAEPEIRRFSITKDAVTNYVYVKQKLMFIFPSLKINPFTICWKDREGDKVQIWSDEELIIALTEMEGDNKTLYVFPSQNFAQNTADNHAFKTENSMGRIVEQSFYFAVQMFICFISALQHFLEKVFSLPMTKKLELSLLHKLNAEETKPTATRDNLDTPEKVIHYGVQCDGCERQVIGFRYKCAFCPNYDLCQNCETRGVHHEHYMVRIPVPVNRDVEFGKKMMKGLFKFNRHSMRGDRERRGGGGGGGGGHHKHGGPGRHCPFMPSSQHCSSENSGTNGAQGEPSRSIFDQGLPINIEGIIESVMQGLLRMSGAELPAETNEQDPVSTSAKGETPSQPQPESQKNPSSANIFNQNSAQNAAASSANVDVESPASSSAADPSQEMQDHSMGKASWTFLNKDDLGEASNKEQAQNSNGVLNGSGDSQPQTAGNQPQQQQSQQSKMYPQTDQSPSTSSSTNNPAASKIEESLNRMLSMGFNNEGDFLRQILMAKNGSIEQVLDMLLPKRSF